MAITQHRGSGSSAEVEPRLDEAALARPEEYPQPRGGRAESWMQWFLPFGAMSAANW